MSVKAGTAYVDIEAGKVDGISKAAAREAGAVDKTFRGTFKGLAAAAGGIFAGVQVAHFLSGTISEFQESAKVGRLTNAVIQSTGGVANVTADAMSNLANQLALKSGVDDEVIQSGENVLATFTNVRNEAGKGNDIFNQGTEAALNMSAALGTDLQGANIQLGKALNDPIKGITALSRVGVSFTEQQKEQIKTLVESGDTLGAQKIILAELSKEFGGAAAAAADPIAQLQVVLGNAKETIGGALAPLVTQIAPILGSAVTAVAPVLGQALGAILPALTPIVNAIGPLLGGIVSGLAPILGALQPVFLAIGKVAEKLGPIFATIGTALGPVVGSFGQLVAALLPIIPMVAALVVNLISGLAPILPPIIEAITLVAKAMLGGLGKALNAVMPVIVTLATILGGTIARVFTAIAPIIAKVAGIVGNILAKAFQVIGPLLVQIGTVVGDLAGQLLTALLPVLPPLVEVWLRLQTALLPLIPVLLKLILLILPPLIQLLVLLLPPIVQVATFIADVLVSAIEEVISWVTDLGATFSSIWNGIQAVVRFVIGLVKGIIQTELAIIKGIWEAVWGGFTSFVEGIASGVFGAVKGIINGVIGVLNTGIGFLNDTLQIHINIDDPTGITDGLHFNFNGPHIPKIPRLHTGGTFRTANGEREGLALLLDHETVRTPEQEANLSAGRSGPMVTGNTIYAWDAREAAATLAREISWAELTAAR